MSASVELGPAGITCKGSEQPSTGGSQVDLVLTDNQGRISHI